MTVDPLPPPSMGLMQWATGHGSPVESSEDSFHSAAEDLDSPAEDPLPDDWIEFFRYVDDTTLVEVTGCQALRHVAGNTPTETMWGLMSGAKLTNLIEDAEDMGMRINCGKTQAVCISPPTGYATSAMIKAKDETITSQSSVKLLGFVVDSTGGVGSHVDMVKDKFRRRFWSLIHLRKAGIKGFHLYRLYTVLVRPVLEANGVVFHSMLTVGQSKELEKLQKHVLRLCFGPFTCYRTCLDSLGLTSLQDRRREAIRKFTAKVLARDDCFARKWFVRRPEVGTDLRRRRPYVEKKARTEKYMRSPLLYLQKQANDLST